MKNDAVLSGGYAWIGGISKWHRRATEGLTPRLPEGEIKEVERDKMRHRNAMLVLVKLILKKREPPVVLPCLKAVVLAIREEKNVKTHLPLIGALPQVVSVASIGADQEEAIRIGRQDVRLTTKDQKNLIPLEVKK